MSAGAGVDQLRRDPHTLSNLPYAALQHVIHPQLPPDLAHVQRLALVGEGGSAGDHDQSPQAGKAGDDVLRQPIAEVFLLRIAAQVDEGQHGDGGFLRLGETLFRNRPRRPAFRGAAGIITPAQVAPGQYQHQHRGGQNSLAPFAAHGPLCRGHPVSRRAGLRAHLVGPHRLGDVLHGVFADVLEMKGQPVLYLVVYGARNADTSGIGQGLQAGGDVDAVAEKFPFAHQHVPQVDADAELHLPLRGQFGVALGQLALDFHRRRDGVHHGGKFGQNGIPRRVHDAPLELLDVGGEYFAIGGQGAHRGLVVLAHQAGIAHHVGDEHRSEFAL